MSGTAWIVSYVVLYAATLCALAVSITAARNYGRIAGGYSLSVPTGEGLPVGSVFPDLVLVTTSSEEIRPQQWPVALIAQVSVTSAEDVPMFGSLRSLLDISILQHTVICAAGRSEHFDAIRDRVAPGFVVHDSDFAVEHSLRTQYRPYAALLKDGVVVAGRPVTSVMDLSEFVTVATRNMKVWRATMEENTADVTERLPIGAESE